MSKEDDVSSNWHHSVAGGVAGSVSVFFLHPFDVVKTRLQVQDGHQKHLVYKDSWDAVRNMVQKEGWRAFYNGMVPAWIGSGVAWSTYLTVYESIKGFHLYRQGGNRLSPHWHTISAAEAGALVCVLTNPVWLIKTRMQLQQYLPEAPTTGSSIKEMAATGVHRMGNSQVNGGSSSSSGSSSANGAGSSNTGYKSNLPNVSHNLEAKKQYGGFLDALWKIGKEEGLRGYYKGLGPSLVLQTTHGAAQFTVYEELKLTAARSGQLPGDPDRPISSAETTLFAATSKLAASILTYPSQVVRSRLQQRSHGRDLEYKTSWQVIRLTWQHEGLRGFYKGLGPALMRVMPQSAITLVVYENLLTLLRKQ